MSKPDKETVLNETGFSLCYFETEGDRCESCEEICDELFFGNADYWDYREGEYLCEDCLRKICEQNRSVQDATDHES